MDLLQAPLLPTPHSKWAMLTLLLPAPLHIFLVNVPKQEDANHPHLAPSLCVDPCDRSRTGPLSQALSVVLQLWDSRESLMGAGATSRLTSFRKQS